MINWHASHRGDEFGGGILSSESFAPAVQT